MEKEIKKKLFTDGKNSLLYCASGNECGYEALYIGVESFQKSHFLFENL